jgi:hypothetical protein
MFELELELIQTHMTQKPFLWVEVGAHVVRKRPECAGVVWAGAVSRGACVCVCVLSLKPFLGCLAPLAFFVWCSPAMLTLGSEDMAGQGVCCNTYMQHAGHKTGVMYTTKH